MKKFQVPISILALLIVVLVAIVFDIYIIRQIIGFVFLSFAPGLAFLYAIRLGKINILERVLLSVGLSIALLMFIGLFVNIGYPYFGILEPLSTLPLTITLGAIVLMLCVAGYWQRKDVHASSQNNEPTNSISPEKGQIPFVILFAMLPLLSIFGTWLMNNSGNNLVLMFLLLLIPVSVILITFLNHSLPKSIFPLAILTVGISILFMVSLRSSHIVGYDIHIEYYVFQLTKSAGYWDMSKYLSSYNACLSVTILPTIYASLLNIHNEYVYKVIFPLIFSFVPLGLYAIYKKYVSGLVAFLSVFFFISQEAFIYWIVGLAKQSIGILFFVLSILLLFDEEIDASKRKLLFIIFGASLVVSHYSTAYIYVALLSLTWLLLWIFRRHEGSMKLGKSITGIVIALFSIVIFLWYGQVTHVPFTSFIDFSVDTLRNLGNFFIVDTRSGSALGLLGIGHKFQIPYLLSFAVSGIIKFFIAVGVLYMILNVKKVKYRADYIMLSLSCMMLLGLFIIVPYVSTDYNLERFILQLTTILAPACILGGSIVLRRLHVRASIVCAIVVLFFLCQSGFVAQLFGTRTSVSLNNEGMYYDKFYVHDQEVYAAAWLSGVKPERVYADEYGALRLRSYGRIPHPPKIFDPTRATRADDAYIYLRYTNLLDKKMIESEKGDLAFHYKFAQNMTEFFHALNNNNKIYDNAGAQVYR